MQAFTVMIEGLFIYEQFHGMTYIWRLANRLAPSRSFIRNYLAIMLAVTFSCLLNRRAFFTSIGAINTTVPMFGFKNIFTVRAFIKELACVSRHCLFFFKSAKGTGNCGFEMNFFCHTVKRLVVSSGFLHRCWLQFIQ